MSAELVTPTPVLRAAFLEMLRDYAAVGEQFRHGRLHATLRQDFDGYVEQLLAWAQGKGLQQGWVPHDMFWLVERGRILGEATLRHYLVPELLHEGGHIGYRIAPSARRQGYGKQILKLMLEKARERGLPRALVTCDSDNVGSARIIRGNGGVFENEVISHSSGKPVSRFWIALEPEANGQNGRRLVGGEPGTVDKVTMYLTRGSEVLLLLHPQAGVQLPAGTVEEAEAFTNAAWRELYEEAGVAQARLLRKLGEEESVLSGDERCLLRTDLLTYRPGGHAISLKLQRGSWVRELERYGAYSKVRYEEREPVTGRLFHQRDGWIATRYLATRIVRHHFHLLACQPTPRTWQRRADGHRFTLSWAPLQPRPHLVPPQDTWLATHYANLLAAVNP